MQENLFISVIIPVFNSEKFIGRCLRSLINQTLKKKNYEIIIINDGSNDKTRNEIIKYKKSNFKIINNKNNLGLAKSLNIGVKAAIGSLMVRVDSDDWVHKDFLNIMSTFLFHNKDLDSVACDYTVTNSKEKNIKIENCLKKPIGCAIMFRLQHILELGLYNEKFKYAEEEAFRKIYLKKYTITRLPISLYRYRQHKNNRSKNAEMVKHFRNKLKNV